MPNTLDEDNIRVEGIQNATIFDVIYAPPSAARSDPEKDSEVQAATSQLTVLESDKQILDKQAEFLEEYAKTMKAENTAPADLEKFLNTYASERKRINDALQEIVRKIAMAKVVVAERQKALRNDDVAMRRRAGLKVIVLSDVDGPATISLQYSGLFHILSLFPTTKRITIFT